MPACLNSDGALAHFQPARAKMSGGAMVERQEQSARPIHIGLINNMPDGALESTERQFLSLLDAASGDLPIRMSLYSLPEIPRKGAAASHIRRYYSESDALWGTHLDGLIVTGREPVMRRLEDEAYWGSFTRVLEWARENTYSTVWSCLAAHAAVFYCDGVSRVKSDTKHCGVFECSRVEDHPLTAGIGRGFRLPHSRWNGVPESALRSRGYHVLTRSAAVGADIFIKQYKSLFVFFQGHPEYDSDTLLLEYRRDVGRYLRGESHKYPAIPVNYFSEDTTAVLQAFQREALRDPRRELLADVYTALLGTKIETAWRPGARSIYKRWIEHMWAQKQVQMRASDGPTPIPIRFNSPAFPSSEDMDREENPQRVAVGR
ncbi:MAG: homoserine O-succinyltransferase [Acidobacteriaceae bacterium]